MLPMLKSYVNDRSSNVYGRSILVCGISSRGSLFLFANAFILSTIDFSIDFACLI